MESLMVGLKFAPTDEELISHYLRLKNDGRDSEVQFKLLENSEFNHLTNILTASSSHEYSLA
ncbi:protein NTM1-like 9 [Fagus crenata]